MTVSELKEEVTKPYFFTRDTMKFFGDTMKNYGVCSTTIINLKGENMVVWELFRKYPNKYGLQKSKFFRKDNFKSEYKL